MQDFVGERRPTNQLTYLSKPMKKEFVVMDEILEILAFLTLSLEKINVLEKFEIS